MKFSIYLNRYVFVMFVIVAAVVTCLYGGRKKSPSTSIYKCSTDIIGLSYSFETMDPYFIRENRNPLNVT